MKTTLSAVICLFAAFAVASGQELTMKVIDPYHETPEADPFHSLNEKKPAGQPLKVNQGEMFRVVYFSKSKIDSVAKARFAYETDATAGGLTPLEPMLQKSETGPARIVQDVYVDPKLKGGKYALDAKVTLDGAEVTLPKMFVNVWEVNEPSKPAATEVKRIEDAKQSKNTTIRSASEPAPMSTSPEKKDLTPFDRYEIKMGALVGDQVQPSIKVVPGQVFKVVYEGRSLDPEVYTYSIKDKVKPRFRYELDNAEGRIVPLEGLKETAKIKEVKIKDETILKIFEPLRWTQDVAVETNAKPGKYVLSVKELKIQICDSGNCMPGKWPGKLALPIEVESIAPDKILAPSAELKKRIEDAKNKIDDLPASSQHQLMGFLIAAFWGAFFMLLTPCVFPMIPITVNFFLKHSERENHRALPMAIVYCGTIVVVLTAAVLLLGNLIVTWANNHIFNLILGAAMFYFALSLFGMYEIELPRFLTRFTSAREGQGGMLGTVFMALTFTITSFTCTGPFLGLLLATIATNAPPWHHVLLGALVYATTFAAPFFLLALFPSLLRSLPKSGGWLNTVKVTMGFLELAFALKFLANTDSAWFPGQPMLFNYDTVLVAWIVLSFACALYLFGFFRLPHDDPGESIGVLRMIAATIMLGLGVYMTPMLYGQKPKGIVANGILAFLPPDLKAHGHLDYQAAYDEAVASKKLIFIDFTGVNCTNCRDNEQNVFPLPGVAELLKQYVVVQLYTDSVPNPNLSRRQAEELAEKYAEWRDKLTGKATNPLYLVVRPDRDVAFGADGVPKVEILGTREASINSVPDFIAFLEKPLKDMLQAK